MNALLDILHISPEIRKVLMLILGILLFASILFFIWGKIKPSPLLDEMKTRLKSWWIMTTIFLAAVLIHPLLSFISIGFLSFIALRELYAIGKLRESDRAAVFWSYLTVPVQYYLAYQGWYHAFLIFIPVFMYIWIPFWLVVQDDTKKIIQAMTIIPAMLILTVYGLSHMAYLLSLPESASFPAGGKALILFLVFLTEINDVMQFVWGKILGKRKILPNISPNKTWEGLIGGAISTMLFGYWLGFLTPLNDLQVILTSLVIAFTGFTGDIVVSAIKRNMGLKDTGKSIPGHGGILDRIDSLTLTASVFFHLIYFMAYA